MLRVMQIGKMADAEKVNMSFSALQPNPPRSIVSAVVCQSTAGQRQSAVGINKASSKRQYKDARRVSPECPCTRIARVPEESRLCRVRAN